MSGTAIFLTIVLNIVIVAVFGCFVMVYFRDKKANKRIDELEDKLKELSSNKKDSKKRNDK